MASINTRSSKLAIKKEVTEGTPVAPVSGADYLALNPDFGMSPSFSTLENSEVKSSLGPSKSIQGLAEPSAEYSGNYRGSGVEGQLPGFSELIESSLGESVVKGTETTVAGGSTVSVVEVADGTGYERGMGVLVKNPSGYEMRPIDSVSGTSLTLGFDLDGVPTTGVGCGKPVVFKPLNSGLNPTLSLWYTIGTGARALMSGARVTSSTYSFAAGEIITMSHSLEGIDYKFNWVDTNTNYYIDFVDDAGTQVATVAQKYWNNPHEFAAAVQTAMDGASSNVITCVYNDADGKYTLTSDGTTFSLLFNTGVNAANSMWAELGFANADQTAATTYTSSVAFDPTASDFTPAFDSSNPIVAKDNHVYFGDSDDLGCFEASSVEVSIETPKTDILSVCAESGKAGSVVSSRVATITITALLDKYDADKWRRYKENDNAKFLYNWGTKSGGNWQPGKSGFVYAPNTVITEFDITSEESLATLNMTLQSYVNDNGDGEIYLTQM
jgi:hypothetical protein